jgi:hypothetical protein
MQEPMAAIANGGAEIVDVTDFVKSDSPTDRAGTGNPGIDNDHEHQVSLG